jgi:N-methylhydantoinase A/oxoprolinase/acetone carboxylase beta subunit
VDQPALDLAPTGEGDAVIERREVWFGGWTDTPVLDRERLTPGTRFAGPAIVEEAGGTSVILPGWQVEAHASGALICRREDG